MKMMNTNPETDQRFEDVYEPRSKGYTPLRNYHLVEQAIGESTPIVSELEAFLPTLPTVKPDGRSDCPFAREMFRRKDRLESKVREKLVTLRNMAGEIQQEVARCARNLERIGIDKRKVHSGAVQGACQKAETRQEEEYMEAIAIGKRLDQAILRADATVGASSHKVFPGADIGSGVDTHLPGTATTDPPKGNGETRIRDEVDDLLALDSM
jgi:hypothetical protein